MKDEYMIYNTIQRMETKHATRNTMKNMIRKKEAKLPKTRAYLQNDNVNVVQ